jgi:hypothetical protein
LLTGYDFITDATVANDGSGRDADPSDPGDWINSTDTGTSQFKTCNVQISSWHGTRTAGILGALTNNSRGVAGMTWQAKILPVRVLGKCGGFDSDIIAGLVWADRVSAELFRCHHAVDCDWRARRRVGWKRGRHGGLSWQLRGCCRSRRYPACRYEGRIQQPRARSGCECARR